MEKVSLVGLGKLGLSLAATLADSGRQVLGVDIDEQIVNTINSGRAPLPEPGLEPLLQKLTGKTLEATTDIARAVSETDYTIILVQTPSESDGRYGLRALRGVLEVLCAEIKRRNKKGHLISVNSTIQPGSMDGEIIPYIEKSTGCKNGVDISVCYNPEMVALGTTIKDFLYPDFVLVGANDPLALERVTALQRSFIRNEAPVKSMTAVSAEIVKIAVNSYLTMKISFANLISQLSVTMPGAEVDKITEAIGTDARVGNKFIKAGNSFGGTCFPRDVSAFSCFLRDQDVPNTLTTAIAEINQRQTDMLVALVRSFTSQDRSRKVCILGQSFKPDTHVIAESSAISLITQLLEDGVHTTVYDPYAKSAVKSTFGYALTYAESAQAAMAEDSVIVLYNPVPEYLEAAENAPQNTVIIDCWRALNPDMLPANTTYIPMGDGPQL